MISGKEGTHRKKQLLRIWHLQAPVSTKRLHSQIHVHQLELNVICELGVASLRIHSYHVAYVHTCTLYIVHTVHEYVLCACVQSHRHMFLPFVNGHQIATLVWLHPIAEVSLPE